MVRSSHVFAVAFLSSLVTAMPLQNNARSNFNIQSAAVSYVANQWKVSMNDVYFQSAVTQSSGTSALLRQRTNAQPIWNSFASVDFDKANNVVDFSYKYYDIGYIEGNMPTVMVEKAVAAGSSYLNATWSDSAEFEYTEPNHLGYIASGERAKYVYILKFKGATNARNYIAYISAVDANVEWVVDADTSATISDHTLAPASQSS